MAKTSPSTAPSDFQEHLANLDKAGLLTRIDKPVCKDTEIHPLVRWQFLGGYPEDNRRAFLFTNVKGAKGESYDIPVVVGALAASDRIYAMGMGVPVEDLGDVWIKGSRASPIRLRRSSSRPRRARRSSSPATP
jgi:4-hydroxy-3-polyprenylbenzoate decarboxylase